MELSSRVEQQTHPYFILVCPYPISDPGSQLPQILYFDTQMQFSLEKYLLADSVKLQLEEMDVVQNVKESMQVFNRGQHSFKSEKLEEAFHFVT